MNINDKEMYFNKVHPTLLDGLIGHHLIEDFNVLEPLMIKVSGEYERSTLGIPQLIINVPLTVGCFKVCCF